MLEFAVLAVPMNHCLSLKKTMAGVSHMDYSLRTMSTTSYRAMITMQLLLPKLNRTTLIFDLPLQLPATSSHRIRSEPTPLVFPTMGCRPVHTFVPTLQVPIAPLLFLLGHGLLPSHPSPLHRILKLRPDEDHGSSCSTSDVPARPVSSSDARKEGRPTSSPHAGVSGCPPRGTPG